MASQTFPINFPQGWYMSWFATTQAGNNIIASLTDEVATQPYFSGQRQNTNIQPPMAQGSATVQGTKLVLTINIPAAAQVLAAINSYQIATAQGVMGMGFNFAIEDGIDNDYNDICVSLVCWKSKG